MTMSVKAEPQKSTGIQECAGCGKKIQDRYLLKALDMYWHEDCLKCGCCDCRLGEVGSTLYTKGNLILCKRDYLRLFGNTGYCAACNKVIPAFEMVMRARTNVYHLECFACQQCNHRFCVGDRFFLCENKILCEYDYEERMVFANLAYNSNNLAHIKQQARQQQQQGKDGPPQPHLPNGMPGGGGPQHPPPPMNGMLPPPPPGPPHMNGHGGGGGPPPPPHHLNGSPPRGGGMPPLPPMSSMVGPGGPPPPPPTSSAASGSPSMPSSSSTPLPLPPMTSTAGPPPPPQQPPLSSMVS